MPHGTPDWGLVGPKTTTYGLDDLGEHAVRLKSPHLWDRRGDVVIIDTFEHGLAQAVQHLDGLNAAIVLMGGEAWHGAFCAKLTTGSGDTRAAGLEYPHGRCVGSPLGIEFTFTPFTPLAVDEGTTAYWYWEIFQRTLGMDYRGCVRYDLRGQTLEYQDIGGGWVEFANGLEETRATDVWHTGKLVVDYINRLYVRFILNDHQWNLPGIPVWHNPGGGRTHITWVARLYGQAGENQSALLDAVICTQNDL